MPQTLLLADDSVTIQRVIELTFADEDIEVVAVSDGDQAIARLDAMPPDIVLVDVGMPGKSGYEVAEYVKQSPQLSHIPVVLLTGAFEPVDEAKAAAAGCDGVLAKPFEPQLVIGRVKELLAPAQAPIGSDAGPPPFAGRRKAPRRGRSRAIDDYFDQLDAALSNLSVRPTRRPCPVASPEIDWFGLKPEARRRWLTELPMHRRAPEPAASPAAPAPDPHGAATFRRCPRALRRMPMSSPRCSQPSGQAMPSTARSRAPSPVEAVARGAFPWRPFPWRPMPSRPCPRAAVPETAVPAPRRVPARPLTDDLVEQVSRASCCSSPIVWSATPSPTSPSA